MTRDEKMAKAVEMRGQGVILDEIAAHLGVSRTTIVRWTNPAYAEHQRSLSLAWKDRNRERNRARDREYVERIKVPCPRCGEKHSPDHSVCQACRSAASAARRELAQRLWAEGNTLLEIAEALGSTRASIGAEISRWRQEGYDFPHRYRMANGRRIAA